MLTTTITLCQDTKEMLDGLKHHPEENYDEVIVRLLQMVTDHEPLKEETSNKIKIALEDLKQGKYYTEEEIEVVLGVA